MGGRSPMVQLSIAPATVNPGNTATVTTTIEAVNGSVGGLYLVVDRGTFTLVNGDGTRLLSDHEITHSQPKAAVGGSVIFQVHWTAPAAPGAANFSVWAVSANNNNSPSGDGAGMDTTGVAFGCQGRTYYADFDGDGYASPNAGTILGCTAPPGYSLQMGDCDDNDPQIYPGAPERCNKRDDNCDGQIDEGLTTATTTVYEDKDGDGYGVNAISSTSSMTITGCAVPKGFALVRGDCNDLNANIHPGATEVCNYADDNCNGKADEGVRFQCGVGICRRDALLCDSMVCTPGEPQVEVCNGLDDDCDGVVDNGDLCPNGQVCLLNVCQPAGSLAPDAGVPGGNAGGAGGAGDPGMVGAGGSLDRDASGGSGAAENDGEGKPAGCAFTRSGGLASPSTGWMGAALAVIVGLRRRRVRQSSLCPSRLRSCREPCANKVRVFRDSDSEAGFRRKRGTADCCSSLMALWV